jgi:hypothetical protein
MAQGEHFEVERRARLGQSAERQNKRDQQDVIAQRAYRRSPASSTAATRTEFSEGTPRECFTAVGILVRHTSPLSP